MDTEAFSLMRCPGRGRQIDEDLVVIGIDFVFQGKIPLLVGCYRPPLGGCRTLGPPIQP